MITIYDIEQGTDEWHKIRAGLYTGSNSHKLLKTNDKNYALTQIDHFRGNFSTDRGHTLEAQAIKLYEKIKGVTVDRPGFVKNDKYPKCGYSPDGLLTDRTLEVKAFNKDRHYANSEYLEMEIEAQTQFGQLICEKDLTDVLLYNPDLDSDHIKDKLFIITKHKNQAIHDNFIKRLP